MFGGKKKGLGDAYGRQSNRYDTDGKLMTNKNHLPSFKSYDLAGFKISKYMGSSQIMSVADHKKYITTGSGTIAKEFRKAEAGLLKQGKFLEAFDLNAHAIKKQFGNKYSESIKQARQQFIDEVIPILKSQIGK